MLKDLVKLANHLDAKGLRKEADYLDGLLQKWAQENPGSAFNAAQRQGAEADAEAARTKLTAEVQKTVDWFNNEVLPAVRSGGPLNLRVPQDLVYGIEETKKEYMYIVGGQTISSLDNPVQMKLDSGWKGTADLKYFYEMLEDFVVKNNLRVTMESDVSEELGKVS